MVIVHRSLRGQDCMERSLVLAAMDIDYFVQRTWWGWCLLVPEPEEAEARRQLALYEQEQRLAPARVEAFPLRAGSELGVLAYVAVLLTVFLFQGKYSFGVDWATAGRVDVAAIRAGEYWRTITALTLHRDVVHLVSNLVFGAFFAALLGGRLGGGVAWLAILLAGAGGNYMNSLLQGPEHLSLGASTAVFATLGLLATYFSVPGRLNRETWARRWAPIVGGLWVLSWLGTGDARTDIVAHLTGFIAGCLLGIALARIPRPTHDGALQWLTGLITVGVVTAAWALALGWRSSVLAAG